MKILIVDDHTEMRKILRSIVTEESGRMDEIIECEDGFDAVEQFSRHQPDFVLMDVQLKGMNGFIATEKIHERYHSAKVIVVTSHNSSAFRQKAIDLHAIGFVTKDNLSEIGRFLHN